MRGRLWVLYLLQSMAAAFCCGLSRFGGSLGGTMAMAVCMALAVTAASGEARGPQGMRCLHRCRPCLGASAVVAGHKAPGWVADVELCYCESSPADCHA